MKRNVGTYFKGQKLYISIILVVALLGTVYLLNQAGLFSTFGLSFTPLSCSSGNFISNDAFYKNGSYFCSVAANGAKSFQLTLSPDEVKRLYGVTTSTTATIDGQITKSTCTYNLLNDSQPVYEIGLDLHHLFCGGSGYYCGDPRTAPWIKIGNTAINGCNFAAYECTTCGVGKQPNSNSCDASYYKPLGRIYTIDQSSLQSEFEFQITTTINGKQYTNYITDKNSTFYNDLVRGEYAGSFLGASSCSPPNLAVFMNNNNQPSYVLKPLADAVVSSNYVVQSHALAISDGNSYNAKVQAMQNSAHSSPENFFGQYCTANSTSAGTLVNGRVSCNPTVPAAIPVVNLYFNAADFAIVAPSGNPQIQSVTAQAAQASQKSNVAITTKNTGDKATFDFSVSCSSINPQVFTVRDTLDNNEIKTVNVPTSFAGASASCLAEVKSVNSPQIKDSKTVSLTFYPFCSLTQTSSAQSLVNTALGCAYVCPNYMNGIDVFDGNCQPITKNLYDRCRQYNGTQCVGGYTTYDGIHCTGTGTYLTTNQYLDQLNSNKIQPFIPSSQSHKFFIVSINGKPICNYVDEFGYKDGVAVSVNGFDYNSQFPSATLGSAPPPLSSPNDQPSNLPPNPSTGNGGSNPPSTNPPPISLPPEIGGLNTTVVLIIGGIIVVALGYGVWRARKKR